MFEKGHAKIGGREKGKPNKRTLEIQEYANERGVSPANFCIDLLAGDTEAIGKDSISFDDKKWAIELLMPYLYGKRKPIDSDGSDKSNILEDLLSAINDK